MSAATEFKLYSTRFQGSKRRTLQWMLDELDIPDRAPGTFFDAFCGSGVVSYAMASHGWRVTGCDLLAHSGQTLRAFIANTAAFDPALFLEAVSDSPTGGFEALRAPYEGVFYLPDELDWLLRAAYQASLLDEQPRAIASWAIAQSALSKRPYNLFHRANLAMRTREVKRSFGNKATWEKPFSEHFKKFAAEALALRLPDAPAPAFIASDNLLVAGGYDLVYLDPPYISGKGAPTPYQDFYSFLDLLLDPGLVARVDHGRPHKPLARSGQNPWSGETGALAAFSALFETHSSSEIAVSYRDDGRPSVEQIAEEMSRVKDDVRILSVPIRYALSRSAGGNETLIVGR